MIMDLLLLSGSIVVVEFAFGRLGRETFPWGKELSLTTISSAQQPSFYSIFTTLTLFDLPAAPHRSQSEKFRLDCSLSIESYWSNCAPKCVF
jgi:hypothetical protein